MKKVFKSRVEECQNKMRDSGAGLMVLFPGPNMTYLSGIDVEPGERHFLMFLNTEDQPIFMAPELEKQKFEDEDVRFWSDNEDPVNVVEEIVEDLELSDGKVLLDDRMWEVFSQDVRGACPGKEFGLASEVLGEMRMEKNEEEIENIRQASKIADRVVEDVRNLGRAALGMTEEELKQFIEERLDEYGGEGTSFPTIVASGPNGSKPHHEPEERKIQKGEPVVLDFGCWKNSYPSDQTRTMVFGGEPSDQLKEVFETVKEAQRKAVEAVRPGVETGEIDRIAREVIENAGYGDKFTHRTGHGVGMEVHEKPSIKENGDTVLKPGMVFSIEPGIYIEDKFGVRIEDLVLVTDNGYERLNKTRRDWKK